MEKTIRLSWKSSFQELIYNLIISSPLFLAAVAFLFFEILFTLIFGFFWIITFIILLAGFFIKLFFGAFDEYIFHSDRIEERRGIIRTSKSIHYNNIESIDLIEDDIISMMLGLVVLGISVKERGVIDSLNKRENRDVSAKDVVKVVGWVAKNYHHGGRMRSGGRFIRIKGTTKKEYDMIIVASREDVEYMKEFLEKMAKQ